MGTVLSKLARLQVGSLTARDLEALHGAVYDLSTARGDVGRSIPHRLCESFEETCVFLLAWDTERCLRLCLLAAESRDPSELYVPFSGKYPLTPDDGEG